MIKKYKIGFEWGLITFTIIMIPNFIWFAVPTPNDILRGESIIKVVDVTFVLYMMVDTILVMLYCVVWVMCFKRNSVFRALALYIIPLILSLFSGIISRSVCYYPQLQIEC